MQKHIGKTGSNGAHPRSLPWAPLQLEFLKDPVEAHTYLKSVIEDGEMEYILIALNKVAKAQGGFSELARKTGLSRENLYTALSPDGNPRFDSITKILHSLGFRMSIEPLKPVPKAKSKRLPKTSNPKARSSSIRVSSVGRTKSSSAKAK
jgi:probable addiction module antidote protein